MTKAQTLGVIGCGTMGNGIAHVAARSGLKVVLHDLEQSRLDRALETIEQNLDREVEKSKISADVKSAALSRIVATTKMPALAEADFVIEAVTENLETKSKVFQAADAIARPGVILASNTSSISITKIAAKTQRPDKVVGMHFMNPVPVMTLVEIVRGLATSDETYQSTKLLAESLGKTPVEVNDFPGFVSNRVLMPMINEAIYCVMEG
jgi:3-hydroxybutyryl-CoA dehydrogenase